MSAVDDVLRGDLLACWTEVTNAGGAVGFVPPVTQDDVAPVLDRLLEGVHSGRDVLAVLTVDGATAGFASIGGLLQPAAPALGDGPAGAGAPVPPGAGPRPGADARRARHRPRPRPGVPAPGCAWRHRGRRLLPGPGLHRGRSRAGRHPGRSGRRPRGDPAGPPALTGWQGGTHVSSRSARLPGHQPRAADRPARPRRRGRAPRVLGELVQHRSDARGDRPARPRRRAGRHRRRPAPARQPGLSRGQSVGRGASANQTSWSSWLGWPSHSA